MTTDDRKTLQAWQNVGPVLSDLLRNEMIKVREARQAARILWLMFTYREKADRDRGQTEWIKQNCPWILEEEP